MKQFLEATRFLTRFPAGTPSVYTEEAAGAAVPWYPVVGLFIGALLVLVAGLGQEAVSFDSFVTAVLVVVVWTMATGALHLDGLADCADALMAGHNGDRMLEIMQDTHCGVGAIVAIVLVLLLKVATVAMLLGNGLWFLVLIPPVGARIALVWCVVSEPYLRSDGLGAGLKEHVPGREAVILSGMCAIVICIVSITSLVAAAAGLLAGFLIIRYSIIRKVGGTTGDVYGAVVEVCECCTLAFMVALM